MRGFRFIGRFMTNANFNKKFTDWVLSNSVKWNRAISLYLLLVQHYDKYSEIRAVDDTAILSVIPKLDAAVLDAALVQSGMTKAKRVETAVAMDLSMVLISALVFAHALLDTWLNEAFEFQSNLKPTDFDKRVLEKKISLNQLRKSTEDQLFSEAIKKELEILGRESLSERVKFLIGMLNPQQDDFKPQHLPEFKWSEKELKRIDDLRHDVIHRSSIPLDLKFEDVRYLRSVVEMLQRMFAKHHNLNVIA